jgi:predicted nucleic acid-binding protein
MNLVDSCGWIEYFADTTRADFYAEAIENSDELIVPVICIMEVFKKIQMERDEDSDLLAVGHMRQGKIIPVTVSIALTAASFGREYKLPLADSIIYAIGIISGATIFTQDEHFKGLDGVAFCSIDTV